MLEARPTIMTAVPRLYETMHQRILHGVEREGGLKAEAVRHGGARSGASASSARRRSTLGERLIDRALDRLVRAKLRGAVRRAAQGDGLGRGAAQSRNRQVLRRARRAAAAGLRPDRGLAGDQLPIRPARIKIDTVGPPLDGVEVKIADDGEILVRGDNRHEGLLERPEATARTIDDGWLQTGDIGQIDADGYILITDRKRDFIKNSGGDMIVAGARRGRS